MKQQIYALIALSLLTFCTCKNCIDSKTSKNFIFDISLTSKDENNLGKAEIIVKIIDKKRNEEIQKISFMSEFILKSESPRSFIIPDSHPVSYPPQLLQHFGFF